ncbi:PadR family transcriptional regulator [Streptomyces rubellomurinus subsp. indigoferus]|uniref:PadR family transcriptional regulator n=1 Tax=Streptomyces rubellomurinus (strain ATCC 31215) TaxID=359131 RepID=A0A0F2TCZ1_STRR3|nr:PadR family transcriptional regulator [Streptomyces rubellomurinus]KJS54551.1 PadR family transcriptional regulator [Streptomyces rubellomurinus subsp. indigoferus]KJS60190.1 PadR family transcriptional regulator [Streptomyces rubellomurinus]
MTPVFGHGRLRLYLLKLLDESPRHGYEVIRLLEERFQGLYAPSAGTVYPRLAKLEQEGLVSHSTEGGRKVYRLTDAGRAELEARQVELDELEGEIRDSVAQLAGAIREDVRDSAKDLREELWKAARQAPRPAPAEGGGDPWSGPWGDNESWQRAKEEFAQFKRQAKEQAKRAREQEKAAKAKAKAAEEEARRLREQAKASRTAAQQEALRIKRRVEQQVREHAAQGDWPKGLAEGLSELTKGLAGLADAARWGHPAEEPGEQVTVTRIDLDKSGASAAPADLPAWARTDPAGEPARELERLLDRFRDQVRDAARDGGVSADQLAEARTALGTVGERLKRLLG